MNRFLRFFTGKSFFDRDQYVIGVVGAIASVAIVAGTVQVTHLPFVSGGREYSASFTDAGGLSEGDDVQVAGLTVGTVDELKIVGQRVKVAVTVTDPEVRVGDRSTARIVTLNVLGRKAVSIESRGVRSLEEGGVFAQAIAPYDLTQALEGVTTTAKDLDVAKFSDALDAISETFADTPQDVTGALTGLEQVASAVSERDEALRGLLASTSSVSGVLADRNDEIISLFDNGASLLRELQRRRDAINGVLRHADDVADQLSGLVDDQNGRLAPALKELRQTIRLLIKNKDNLAAMIEKLGPYATALGDAVGSGPFYTAYVPNLSDPGSLPFFPQLLAEVVGSK